MRQSLKQLTLLAFRQLWRERRSSEVRVLFWAVVIAVAASSAIGHFSERLQGAMQQRSGEFLAADLALTGTIAAKKEQKALANNPAIKAAKTIEFATALVSDNGIQLASVKAVSHHYPLRGQLESTAELYGEVEKGSAPQQGEIWLEARLIQLLEVNIGDFLDVGATQLQVTRVLTYEPDRGGNFNSLSPRALMSIKDIPASRVIQPGSRLTYNYLWASEDKALINQLMLQLKPSLLPQQRIKDLNEDNQQVGGALDRAERYLNLASLAAILLTAVAIALSASHFARRRFDHAALLRCLGLARQQTSQLFSIQIILLGAIACILGSMLGMSAQAILLFLLKDMLPSNLPNMSIMPNITGSSIGLITLLGFALPPLMALGKVPPLRVLRRGLVPTPLSSWLIYGSALTAVTLIMWRLSLDLWLTFALIGGILVAGLVLGLIVWLGLKALRKRLANAGLAWRLGFGQLLGHPIAAIGQTLAFGLILMAMALVILLRTELLGSWQSQLPKDAPNIFAINILDKEQIGFATFIESFTEKQANMFPMLPGRLSQINGKPVSQHTMEANAQSTLERDLNLTWTYQLPASNSIVEGRWFNKSKTTIGAISVEDKFAERLHLKLGDKLTFNFGSEQRTGTITSLRSVDWNSMQPNFFVIFSPNSLNDIPHTWMTSFYLAEGQEQNLIAINHNFPSVTLFQLDAILEQLRTILGQVTLAVEFVLLFVLAAGIAVLFAGLQSTLEQRIRHGAILRAIGAPSKLLQKARRNEFAVIGITSGLIAWIGCELSSYLLYRHAFEFEWSWHPWLITLPLFGATVITCAGLIGTRKAINSSPMLVLRGDK